MEVCTVRSGASVEVGRPSGGLGRNQVGPAPRLGKLTLVLCAGIPLQVIVSRRN